MLLSHKLILQHNSDEIHTAVEKLESINCHVLTTFQDGGKMFHEHMRMQTCHSISNKEELTPLRNDSNIIFVYNEHNETGT